MQPRDFRQLTKTERKAKLIHALIGKTQGKLQREELETIVNHRWQLGYKYKEGLSEDLDLVGRQMSFVIHDNAKSFAKAATLQHTEARHSRAGKDTFSQYGNWIIGDGKFGVNTHVSYSNNGEVGSPETEYSVPEFSVGLTQVIAVKSESYDSFNRSETFHEKIWELHILFKDSEDA
jgi:hypothetical protein